MKTVLITGVSSGVGYGLLKEFISAGYRVIGSVRHSSRASELQLEFPEKFTPVVFDINNHWEIDAVVEQVEAVLAGETLAGLINNAGIAEIGPLLHVSMSVLKKQFDTLVFSQLYVMQKFFRFLCSPDQNQPAGRIVTISSLSGKSSNYFFGAYSAAKHAMEGLCKTLREELKMFGIKVIVVAPGNLQTSLWGKQTLEIVEKYKDTNYYASLKTWVTHLNNEVIENAMTVEEFSERFLQVFTDETPADHYTISKREIPHIGDKIVVETD